MKMGRQEMKNRKKMRCSGDFADTPQIFSGEFVQYLLLANYSMFKASEVSVSGYTIAGSSPRFSKFLVLFMCRKKGLRLLIEED